MDLFKVILLSDLGLRWNQGIKCSLVQTHANVACISGFQVKLFIVDNNRNHAGEFME